MGVDVVCPDFSGDLLILFEQLLLFFFHVLFVLVIGNGVSEPDEVVEVVSEEVAGDKDFLGATGETASEEHTVFVAEVTSRVILEVVLDLEVLEAVEGSSSVVPGIPDHVVNRACLELVYWTR